MPKEYIRPCAICGTTFVLPLTGNSNKRYCSKLCRTEALKRRKNERQQIGLCVCGRPARDGRKTCGHCASNGVLRGKHRRSELDGQNLCIDCGNQRLSGKHCEDCKMKKAAKDRYTRLHLKRLIVKVYGGCCTCCGEVNEALLTIDHTNGDGAAHRKEMGQSTSFYLYRYLIQNDFPTDNFRLRCFNCNIGAFWNGGVCPHEQSREMFFRQLIRPSV